MNISLRCLLGHRWETHGHGDLLRVVDNKVCGSFVILRCNVCGKLSEKRFK